NLSLGGLPYPATFQVACNCRVAIQFLDSFNPVVGNAFRLQAWAFPLFVIQRHCLHWNSHDVADPFHHIGKGRRMPISEAEVDDIAAPDTGSALAAVVEPDVHGIIDTEPRGTFLTEHAPVKQFPARAVSWRVAKAGEQVDQRYLVFNLLSIYPFSHNNFVFMFIEIIKGAGAPLWL